MPKSVADESIIQKIKSSEKSILDWYRKTMGCFLSTSGSTDAEVYHERIVDSLRTNPNLQSQHLSLERLEEKLSRQFSQITTISDWTENVTENFAYSYKQQLFEQIKKKVTLDNVDHFTDVVMEIHETLIEEELKIHSYSVGKKENPITKSILENSVKSALNYICGLNVTLYRDELEMECPTFSVKNFAEYFAEIERDNRKRFLETSFSKEIEEILISCAKRLLDLIVVKFSITLLVQALCREFYCQFNREETPMTESEFAFAAKEIKGTCVVKFRKILRIYMKESSTNQRSKATERLIESLLKEIRIHKNQNLSLYKKKLNVVTYYDGY